MEFSERIIRETERKASEIIEEARKQAEKMIQEAHEQWMRKAEDVRRSIIDEARKQASVLIAEAKIRSSIIISKAKQEVVEDLFARVREVLTKRDYDVKVSLRNLITESFEYLETPVRVIVSKEDVEVAREILKELGYGHLEVVGSDKMLGGVIVVSAEGVVVDNSFDTRLKQAESRLLDRIARLLWG